MSSFGLVFNWTGQKKLLAAHWSPWQDLTDHLCTQNVDKRGWKSSSHTFKSLKRQLSLVWTFPTVTISWIRAVKAYDVCFYDSKTILGQSKKFGLVQNVLDMDQIAKFSSEKLFFEFNPKQFRQIQNHLEPVEGQSNSCVMYVLFFILICSTLIKYDFNQCCVS